MKPPHQQPGVAVCQRHTYNTITPQHLRSNTPRRYTRTSGTHSIYGNLTTDRRCAPQSVATYTRAPPGLSNHAPFPHHTTPHTHYIQTSTHRTPRATYITWHITRTFPSTHRIHHTTHRQPADRVAVCRRHTYAGSPRLRSVATVGGHTHQQARRQCMQVTPD